MRAARAVDIEHLKPVMYMGGHSRASLMLLEQTGDLKEVKKRTRWRSDAGIRRYEESSLIQKAWFSGPRFGVSRSPSSLTCSAGAAGVMRTLEKRGAWHATPMTVCKGRAVTL